MPVGLTNQGNTCYMNASLQLIVNSRYIRDCIKVNSGTFANSMNEIIRA